MKKLNHPIWLILLHVLPLFIFFLISLNNFYLFESLIIKEEKELRWYLLFFVICLHFVHPLIFSISSLKKKKGIPKYYHIILLVTNIIFLIQYFTSSFQTYPNDMFIYLPAVSMLDPLTFSIPSIVFSLFTLTKPKRTPSFGKLEKYSLAFILIVPISIFVYNKFNINIFRRIEFPLSICIIFLFLFAFFRLTYLLIIPRKSTITHKVFGFFMLIIFPLLGLLLSNNHLPYFVSRELKELAEVTTIFGDFNSKWYYIIAITNGIVLLSSFLITKPNIILSTVKIITYPFSVLFLLIFLPFLPFSVMAVGFFGIGFLTLSPIVIFLIHTKQLFNENGILKSKFGKNINFLFLGILLIPSVMFVHFSKEKSNLNLALDIVFSSKTDVNHSLNKDLLQSTLENTKQFDSWSRELMVSKTPYVNAFYEWYVFDNLTLSDEKTSKLNSIFFDKKYSKKHFVSLLNSDVSIDTISHLSEWDENIQSWRSQIDLTLVNHTSGRREFFTQFKLPEDCFVNKYYLDIEGERVFGELVEKKAALWIYSIIRNLNRDPGLLYYENKNTISFKIFPFLAYETRTSGFELIHKHPIELTLNHKTIDLGSTKSYTQPNLNGIKYISSLEKQNLPTKNRTPYIHCFIDNSLNSNLTKEELNQMFYDLQIHDIRIKKVSIVGDEITHLSELDLNSIYNNMASKSGGFYADKAIKNELIKSFESPTDEFPVFVLVTNQKNEIILDENYKNWDFAFPNSNFIYLYNNKKISRASLLDKTQYFEPIDSNVFQFQPLNKVVQYEGHNIYIDTKNKSEILVNKDKINLEGINNVDNPWEAGIVLSALNRINTLYPSNRLNDDWQALKLSFKHQILAFETTFISLENETQRKLLKQKQKDVLNGHKHKDTERNSRIRSMSEPSIFVLLGLAILFYVFRFKRS
ncbi:MAG: MSEP-CTERM sorting domain-containing protein [Flavobacteriales bacterium]